MTNEVHKLTPSERIKKSSYSLVCLWVKDAWEKIDTNLIHRLFKCYGISVKTDIFEDNMIFDYDSLIVDKENKENNELMNLEKKNLKRRITIIEIILILLMFE